MITQQDRILGYLKDGQSLTPLVALELFGCMRLAAVIRELRKSGLDIKTDIVHRNGKHYASYRLKTFEEVFALDVK